MHTEWIRPEDLTDVLVSDLLSQVARTTRHDGHAPLSEQATLALRHAHPGFSHVVARSPSQELLGYVQISDDGHAEGFVVPPARGAGVGTQLVGRILSGCPDLPSMAMWAHGDLPGAKALATRFDAVRARELRQMSRPADAPLPEVSLPEGISLRAFVPGSDDDAWLEVNAAAFATHPEQGKWTKADLEARIGEPWFDPEGFLLAVDEDDTLLGFHWTKVHPDDPQGPSARPSGEGEVYVVGIAPRAQGRGLGRALTVAGLRHLAAVRRGGRPLAKVILYVDAENTSAVRMYESLGFTTAVVDVQYVGTRT